MNKTMKVLALAAAVLLAGDARAYAQLTEQQKAFVNVNVGVQLSDRSIDINSAFPLYDEEVTVASTQPVSGGVMFDIGGGYRVWGDVFAGITVSSFGDTAVATTTASIPHPLLFGQPRTVTLTSTEMNRREVGIHTQVICFLPAADFLPAAEKIDIAIFGGPSFIRLKQDLVSRVSVATNTQNATAVVESQSGTAVGFNLGVDGSYSITPRLAAGAVFRYVRGSADLDSLSGAKTGSVQLAFGARVRF